MTRTRIATLALSVLAISACSSDPAPSPPPPPDVTDVPVAVDTTLVDVPATDTPLADAEVDTPSGNDAPSDTSTDTAPDGGCASGQTLCGAACVDTRTDPMNCGACAMACPAGQSCVSGACACAGAEMFCAGACVDVQTSPMHCGACGTTCPMGQGCTMGRCAVPCEVPRVACGAGAAMACVDTQSDAMNCGACGTACAAGQSCVAGSCTCPSGQNNCMGRCVSTQTDNAHCGGCGIACAAGQRCEAARCACPSGQSVCAGSCVDFASDPMNCGVCGNACPSAQLCVSGTCATSCAAPNLVCTVDGRTLCVNPTSDVTHCGGCNAACVRGQRCEMGRCVCPGGQTVCGGACVNTRTDNTHCGACDNACTGGRSCVSGVCACSMGQTFCAGRCLDVLTDNANCGACGNVCGAGQSCVAGVCTCPGGGTVCGGRCIDTAADVANCGRCGNTCAPRASSRATCTMSTCGFTCNEGFGDCDATAANGCEANLATSALHCGRCGNACATRANAMSTCAAGRCGFTCLAGFADCDGDAANGCEVNLQSAVAHCGRCGAMCAAGQVCSMGACTAACAVGTTLCAGACVALGSDVRNCGSCGNVCPSGTNATPACAMATCGLTCSAGFGNCDGAAGNGCEVNVQTTATHCGRCGNACVSGANSTATCAGGTCGLQCATGFGNCDGVASNGCEADLRATVAHCGSCGRACAAGANATPTCAMGTCGARCNAGFGDCNGNTTDGCETNTSNNLGNCGACGVVCRSPTGGAVACMSGTCVQSCPAGQTPCTGACINVQSDPRNCGACGRACSAGQLCAAGACVAISGPSFQVNSLSTAGCAVVDHNAVTGDDRGGIAVSSLRLFYSGDSATARFDLATLANITSIGRVADGLLSNLRTGVVYTLANGLNPISMSGGTVDGLLVVDGSTGALTTTRIAFSSPIALAYGSGVFAGYDRLVLFSGSRLYHIDLRTAATGTVTVNDLGPFTFPTRSQCENWAFWGVSEFFGGNLYVSYVQNSTAIVRTRIPDGATTTIGTYTNLSDMCSFTVSTSNNRWYFHHEYSGQFGGSSETAGYCNAVWTTDSSTVSFVTFPSAASSLGGPGGTGVLGGGGSFRYRAGDFVQETFSRTAPFSRLDLSFQMTDLTSGCAVGQPLTWNVLVNGAVVGTYAFNGGSGVNPRSISGIYTFATQPAGAVTLRLEATSTVCSGGSSWIWLAGGSAIFR